MRKGSYTKFKYSSSSNSRYKYTHRRRRKVRFCCSRKADPRPQTWHPCSRCVGSGDCPQTAKTPHRRNGAADDGWASNLWNKRYSWRSCYGLWSVEFGRWENWPPSKYLRIRFRVNCMKCFGTEAVVRARHAKEWNPSNVGFWSRLKVR